DFADHAGRSRGCFVAPKRAHNRTGEKSWPLHPPLRNDYVGKSISVVSPLTLGKGRGTSPIDSRSTLWSSITSSKLTLTPEETTVRWRIWFPVCSPRPSQVSRRALLVRDYLTETNIPTAIALDAKSRDGRRLSQSLLLEVDALPVP